MSEGTRPRVFLIGALGFAALLLWGLSRLSPFGRYPGPYGDILLAVGPAQRHILNIVTAINFDYRGLDTLGEEFILFTSVAGVSLLLRAARKNQDQSTGKDASGEGAESGEGTGSLPPETSDAVRLLAATLLVITFFFGLYMVMLAHLSLGGGFQGGVILATAWILAYLAGGDDAFHRLTPKKAMEAVDALGAGGYALIGLASLVTGAAFLQNVLPLGRMGSIPSSGAILLINFAVGMEVAAGFLLLFGEFIQENEYPPNQGGTP